MHYVQTTERKFTLVPLIAGPEKLPGDVFAHWSYERQGYVLESVDVLPR